MKELKHLLLTDKIHLLIFNTQKQLTSTFLRFQEHYESKKFKDKIFSLSEFKKWYTKNSFHGKNNKEFTYYSDWDGFNVPSHILKPFYEKKFAPLSKREEIFLRIFRGLKEPYYIMGVCKKTENLFDTINHEIAHGLFYLSKGYKKEVLDIMSKYKIKHIKNKLRKLGYHESVVDDECNGYILFYKKYLNITIPKKLADDLKRVYNKYLKVQKVKIPTKI